MKILYICVLVVSFHNLQSQSLTWYEGVLILSNNEILRGKFAIEQLHDIILYQDDIVSDVFPAHKVRSLYFYDEKEDINRRFVSVKQNDMSRPWHQIYEIVVAGEVTVMRRKKASEKHLSNASSFTYHIQYQDSLIPFGKFTKQIYPILSTNMGSCLEEYIRKNRLRTYHMAGSIQIIEFYNRSSRSTEVQARR